jgi:endonuclease III
MKSKSTPKTKKPAPRKPRAEDVADTRKRGKAILSLLRAKFPGAATALHFDTPFQLLIATILSAQCTDERVNIVTKDLFSRYPGPADLAHLAQPELEKIIHSAGFFRMKAKNIIACSKGIMERFDGRVPDNLDDLVSLAGVGRKTANVVLGQAFGIASGVVVDTHVHRLSQRLGLATTDTPEEIERELMAVFPKNDWIDVGSIVILHGRSICKARTPLCAECFLRELCPSVDSF